MDLIYLLTVRRRTRIGYVVSFSISLTLFCLFLQPSTPQAHSSFIQEAGGSQSAHPGDISANAETNSANHRSQIEQQYFKGQISKTEAINEIITSENRKSLNFHGLVLDQNDQPVTSAKVEGSVLLNGGMTHSAGMRFFTDTDEKGRFNFIGLHGMRLGIWPRKAGYFYNLKLEPKRPEGLDSSPTHPVVFTMWKMRGPQELQHTELSTRVPYDGTSKTIKLGVGEPGMELQLRVNLWRSLQKIKPGVTKYDWHVEVQIADAKLRPESDAYPYWSPKDGYEPQFRHQISSNAVPWLGSWQQNFYVKTTSGKYGRMFIDLNTAATRPDSGITIETWFNPSGSQNLEFEPEMRVR